MLILCANATHCSYLALCLFLSPHEFACCIHFKRNTLNRDIFGRHFSWYLSYTCPVLLTATRTLNHYNQRVCNREISQSCTHIAQLFGTSRHACDLYSQTAQFNTRLEDTLCSLTFRWFVPFPQQNVGIMHHTNSVRSLPRCTTLYNVKCWQSS
jgi:hypothetical protein